MATEEFMLNEAIKRLNVEEIICLSNCLREAEEYLEVSEPRFLKHVGVGCKYTETLRDAINGHIDSRPDYMDDPEPWVSSPSLSHMSIEVIAQIPTKELLCFSNCIKLTLEYLDVEEQFDTRVGCPTVFARVFRQALELELAKRDDAPDL